MYNTKRSQAGRVGSKRADKVQGAGGRVVRNSRGWYRQSFKVRIRQEADRMQVQGPMGTIHQGTDCRSG
ncbi:unnamed protein product, partial [Staurois parvus]